MRGKVAVGIVALLILGHVLKLTADAGAFKSLTPHSQWKCERSDKISGAEDMEWDSHENLLFISSDSRPGQEAALASRESGALWLLDLSQPAAQALRLESKYPAEFHPHGIAIFRDGEIIHVAAINHRALITTIDFFEYSQGVLTYKNSVESSLFENSNDLILVDSRKFFVVLDHYFQSPLMKTIEDLSRFGQGSIVYFDGEKPVTVDRGINFPAGILLSPDKKQILVSSLLNRKILIFDWDKRPSVKKVREISLGTSPDNMTWDSEGALWIGAHPNLFQLKAHRDNHLQPSASQVLKITDALSDHPTVTEFFLNSGELISAVSVAFHNQHQVVLGSIFDTHLARCFPQ